MCEKVRRSEMRQIAKVIGRQTLHARQPGPPSGGRCGRLPPGDVHDTFNRIEDGHIDKMLN